MLAGGLPDEPTIFTMAHELKHHLVDSGAGPVVCRTNEQTKRIEIGAEVFASELIYPEKDFMTLDQRRSRYSAWAPHVEMKICRFVTCKVYAWPFNGVLAAGEPAVKVITCPLENFDATDVVALRSLRSYVASLPSGRDRAGTERGADRTCEICQRRSFQNC
jgi:hypothetical protein